MKFVGCLSYFVLLSKLQAQNIHTYSNDDLINQVLLAVDNKGVENDFMTREFLYQMRTRAQREEMPGHIRQMLLDTLIALGNEGDRGIGCHDCAVPMPLWGIWNYGCWCNFGPNLMSGNGNPVNLFDAACKKLQQCLLCTEHDFNCDPKTKKFNARFNWRPNLEALNANCREKNPGDKCAQTICVCELTLIADILELTWSQVLYDPQYLHTNGWIRDDHCPPNKNLNGNGNGHSKECCGIYPDRQKYVTKHFECCDDIEIFNPMSQECCSNGSVHDAGSCP